MRSVCLLAFCLAFAGCDTTDDGIPVGFRTTIGGEAFNAEITRGFVWPDSTHPILVSGGIETASETRYIVLNVPGRTGVYTEAGASAVYGVLTDTDDREFWYAGSQTPGSDLEIRVTAADAEHAEGTFAFTGRHADDPSRFIEIAGGTFNVALEEPPDAMHVPQGSIFGAARPFDGVPVSTDR